MRSHVKLIFQHMKINLISAKKKKKDVSRIAPKTYFRRLQLTSLAYLIYSFSDSPSAIFVSRRMIFIVKSSKNS